MNGCEGAGSGISCVNGDNRRRDTLQPPQKMDTPKPERRMACAIDPPTKKVHENPCCSNPNHQLRPIQINALSKPRLVRSYLTGGKPSGENGSHAHGYIELMPKQGASRTYSFLLMQAAVHLAR